MTNQQSGKCESPAGAQNYWEDIESLHFLDEMQGMTVVLLFSVTLASGSVQSHQFNVIYHHKMCLKKAYV